MTSADRRSKLYSVAQLVSFVIITVGIANIDYENSESVFAVGTTLNNMIVISIGVLGLLIFSILKGIHPGIKRFLRQRNLIVIYFISLSAIVSNIYIFSTVTLPILRAWNAVENLMLPVLPVVLFINSFILFTLISFFDLNTSSRSRTILLIATIISAFMIMIPYWMIPVYYYLVIGVMFIVVQVLAILLIRNLNFIPSIINLLVVCIGVLTFYY